MAQIVRSGAFLQQCWSVHPLCVTVKRIGEHGTVVLSCTSCKSAHYLRVGIVVPQDSPTQREGHGHDGDEGTAGDLLLDACITAHRASVSLREMDVFQDLVVLRCADCRRRYTLHVSAFETHQK
ncbi:MAG: hypothetical protein OEY86_17770 [Nitrospira sp.]|nr:hypothetical protein [Nitrospira sp.]